ncbi:MAG: TIGR02391 family protein [Dehalococcoidales bacterium]|nr:TIGR02391 family protein [Dehalococcoidales bacterium]
MVSISTVTQSHTIPRRDLLMTALMGGNNELSHNFYSFQAPVTNLFNRALGAVESGLWSPQEPTPVLVIKDDELRSRCSDLLCAPGNYDRVIREATTVLENRLRNKPPHELLVQLIPNAADQIGDNLVNKLLSPNNPILAISSDKQKRIAFHQIMLGIISYLRNPYHHILASYTEWSWAWSIVGFIDRLLSDIEICVVVK